MCKETALWLVTFAPPLITRLNASAPCVNLTDTDIYSVLSMCAFDTVAHEKPSPFCALYEALEGGAGKARSESGRALDSWMVSPTMGVYRY